MSEKIYIGIDPGMSGAVAVISEDGKIEMVDTPTFEVKDGKKQRREYDVAAMSRILSRWRSDETVVILEKVNAMPGQGVTSMFRFGMGFGIWIGILAALGHPYTLVHSARWKKVMMADMGKEKSAARMRACQLFPQAASELSRVKDDGRAEALLMAEYGRRHTTNHATDNEKDDF